MLEITSADMDFLTAAWLRLPGFFRESERHVRPNYFDPNREGAYLVVWQVLSDLYNRYQTVTLELALHAAHVVIASGQIPLMPGQAEDVLNVEDNGLIASAFKANADDLHLSYCRDVLERFLRERSVLWPMRRLSHGSTNLQTKEALGSLIEQLSLQQRRIATMRELPTDQGIPERGSPLPPASVFHPTGVDWIDRQIGGQREGDCNAFLGFQGAGKSLFSGQLVVASGRAAHLCDGANARWSTLFTYEEPLRNVRPRLWSSALRIDRTKLERLADWNELTTPDRLEAYERVMGSCECERFDANREWFNNTVRAFDMSGSEEFLASGFGGVAEIVATLDQLQNETGRGIRTVVIDWAMPMLQQFAAARGSSDDRALYDGLRDVGAALRRDVAARFHCTVWITHQLRSDASHSPTVLHDHTDAAQCKSFGQSMAYVGVLSKPDPASGVRRFHWPKHRATADDRVPPILLRPHAHFAEFTEVTTLFCVADREIVPTRDATQVPGAAA